jgi:hypothetical protein
MPDEPNPESPFLDRPPLNAEELEDEIGDSEPWDKASDEDEDPEDSPQNP